MTPIGELVRGKKGLIVGIANEGSIAFGCGRVLHRLGAELAVTYLNAKAEKWVRPLAEELASPIIMPLDAPAAKVAATRGYGAEVVTYDRYTQDRLAIGRELAQARGLSLIPPYDHPEVIAGQGTAAKELIEDAGPLDMLLVCLGGGGLLAGCALAAKALNPGCRVFGVEPEAGNDGQQSLRSGQIVRIEVPKTIADGAQTPFLGDYTFPIIQALVEDIVTVSDAALVDAMRFFAERMKLVVEPTGCLAAAAAFTGAVPVAGQRVGVIISGGNVDLGAYARFLAPGA